MGINNFNNITKQPTIPKSKKKTTVFESLENKRPLMHIAPAITIRASGGRLAFIFTAISYATGIIRKEKSSTTPFLTRKAHMAIPRPNIIRKSPLSTGIIFDNYHSMWHVCIYPVTGDYFFTLNVCWLMIIRSNVTG